MCSREVDRDTRGLDHINTTNKYNHDQQLSTIIYQDAGSIVPSDYGQLNLTSQASSNIGAVRPLFVGRRKGGGGAEEGRRRGGGGAEEGRRRGGGRTEEGRMKGRGRAECGCGVVVVVVVVVCGGGGVWWRVSGGEVALIN